MIPGSVALLDGAIRLLTRLDQSQSICSRRLLANWRIRILNQKDGAAAVFRLSAAVRESLDYCAHRERIGLPPIRIKLRKMI